MFALALCELLSDHQLALRLLKLADESIFQTFLTSLETANSQGQYDELVWFARNGIEGA